MNYNDIYSGTDGHLKLADFGLSKQIGVPYSQKNIPDVGFKMDGLSMEAYQKVQKFLPLKLKLAQQSANIPNHTIENRYPNQLQKSTVHRTYKVLLITLDDDKNDSTLLFAFFTIEVIIADRDIDPETIFDSKIDVIFIDGS